jgi:ribosomal protein S18 acetylase RimI-like enzyme
MVVGREIVCWEALDPEHPSVEQARHLYETTLEPAERIPWDWIAGAVAGRAAWRPGAWSAHLLLAAEGVGSRTGPAIGFAYGIHVPDYGGYACYLGVDPHHRGRGAGTRLLRFLVQVLKVDAACEGTPLPFVVWESHAPEMEAVVEERHLWEARLRLFERVGAWWVSGLTFHAPNFARRGERPVPLQLFLVPVDTPAAEWDADGLRAVAAGLLRLVYGRREGDQLFRRTLPPDSRPGLKAVSVLRAQATSANPAS